MPVKHDPDKELFAHKVKGILDDVNSGAYPPFTFTSEREEEVSPSILQRYIDRKYINHSEEEWADDKPFDVNTGKMSDEGDAFFRAVDRVIADDPEVKAGLKPIRVNKVREEVRDDPALTANGDNYKFKNDHSPYWARVWTETNGSSKPGTPYFSMRSVEGEEWHVLM